MRTVKLAFVSGIIWIVVRSFNDYPSNDGFYVFVDISYEKAKKLSRVIDLDIDIGADAVDYKYVFIYSLLSLNLYSARPQRDCKSRISLRT
jgi:hypothetical protein